MVLVDVDYKSVNNNQPWFTPLDRGTAPVLPTASAEGAPTISELKKFAKHTNCLLQHQHDVCQQKKKKTKYKKYQAGLMTLRNLIKTNNEEFSISAHNNNSL